MLKNNHLTVRGVLKGGKTLVLGEDTELPDHLPDVPVTVRVEFPAAKGVIRNGKTLVLEEGAVLPGDAADVPVIVHIELPVGKGVLQAYGAWKDMPEVEHLEEELYELRHGKKACQAEQ